MDKQAIRDRVWDDLEESDVARFPFPPHGRIPNFAGADEAADCLAAESVFANATAIKINPDAPQRPVRRHALESGATLYMAVPRLADEKPFIELDPAQIDDIDDATTISGADEHGVQVAPEALPPIDLVVSGSVAVTPDGTRIGKGEGYSDLEFAVLRELGVVTDDTPVATTIHERQVIEDAPLPASHDVPMDLIVTPERVIRPDPGPKPTGIDWDLLSDDRIGEMPLLQRLQSHDQ